MHKRYEIFLEFLYYLFDSFLIPLIRSNFYVTESNSQRCTVLYFRHDVWRLLTEPSLAMLKDTMLTNLQTEVALNVLESRRLGFSQIRLLPKEEGLRPIMNLRKRTLGPRPIQTLGPSINKVLEPVHSLLKLEKVL